MESFSHVPNITMRNHLLAVLFALVTPCFAQTSPPHAEPAIPIPPAETLPWTPPENHLPPLVVSATQELFDEGLADPRGCEYREIEIASGNAVLTTHGWVLPQTGLSRFAVGWNGVVYPLKSVGKVVSIKDDFPGHTPREDFQGLDNIWPPFENSSLSVDSMTPIKAALLLRLGHADLAEDLWRRGFLNYSPDRASADPYVLMANPWLYALYERAVHAHVSGDDAFALATCRSLLPLWQKAEASASQRHLVRKAKDNFYFQDLAQLPELAADQERRAREATRQTVLESGQPAHGPARIAALIRDLDQVNVQQMMNPGQTDTYNDPVVQALIQEGDAAVVPLLKCWEDDPRLTRTRFTQGMVFPGPLVHVYEPAYVAMSIILDKAFYFSDSDDVMSVYDWHQPTDLRDEKPRDLTSADRKFLGAKIRAYLEKYKGLTLPERWFADLQDDHADAKAWIRAVERIAQPSDQETISYGIYGGSIGLSSPQPPGNPLKGESLRSKSHPSFTDLIIKRYHQLMPRTDADHPLSFQPIGNLVLSLANWDGKAHLREVRDFSQEFQKRFKTGAAGFDSVNGILTAILQRRVALGDPLALRDDADWLQTLSRQDVMQAPSPSQPFQIMWHHPNDPTMIAAAKKLFAPTNSRWVPLPNLLVHTPLIGVAPFRQELLRGLSDTSFSGWVKVESNGLSYDFKQTGGTSWESSAPSPTLHDAPAPGTTVTFRLCDCYAYQLSQTEYFPEFKLYWPLRRRDEALAVCRAYLRQYGHAYQGHPDDPYGDLVGAPEPGTAQFSLPQLDHPATPEDVRAGRAIFSLSGQTRVWKMPAHPTGTAWQAEEVFTGRKWQRYFGVIRQGIPTKVPAEQIDFTPPYPAQGRITDQLGGEILGPPEAAIGGFNMAYSLRHSLPVRTPLTITVFVSNNSGLDVPAPGFLLRPSGSTKTLPAGIGLSVSYSEKLAPVVQRFSEPLFNPAPYHPLPLLKDVVIAPAQPDGPALYPTQKLQVLRVDLRDFFDMRQPGSYQVKARFQAPGQKESDSSLIEFSLAENTD